MRNSTNLVTNATLNAKINDVKNETPGITDLATYTALTDYSSYLTIVNISLL